MPNYEQTVLWTSAFSIGIGDIDNIPVPRFVEYAIWPYLDEVSLRGLHRITNEPHFPTFPKDFFYPGSIQSLEWANYPDRILRKLLTDNVHIPYHSLDNSIAVKCPRRTVLTAKGRKRERETRWQRRLISEQSQFTACDKEKSKAIKRLLLQLNQVKIPLSYQLAKALKLPGYGKGFKSVPAEDPLTVRPGETRIVTSTYLPDRPTRRSAYRIQWTAKTLKEKGGEDKGHWTYNFHTTLQHHDLNRVFVTHPTWICTPQQFRTALEFSPKDLVWQSYHNLSVDPSLFSNDEPKPLGLQALYVLVLKYVKTWLTTEQSQLTLRPRFSQFYEIDLPRITNGNRRLAALIAEPKLTHNQILIDVNTAETIDTPAVQEILEFY